MIFDRSLCYQSKYLSHYYVIIVVNVGVVATHPPYFFNLIEKIYFTYKRAQQLNTHHKLQTVVCGCMAVCAYLIDTGVLSN